MSKRKKIRFTAPSAATRPANANSPNPAAPGPTNSILLNAIENGLTAQTILLPGENAELLRSLANSFIAIYQPADDAEFLIVEEMVVAKWKLRRSWSSENCLVQSEIAIQSAKINNGFEAPKPDLIQTLAVRELIDNSRSLAYFNRQQVRFTREYERALAQLRLHQTLPVESQHTPENPAPPPTANSNETLDQSFEKPKFQNNPNTTEIHPHPQVSDEQGLAPQPPRLHPRGPSRNGTIATMPSTYLDPTTNYRLRAEPAPAAGAKIPSGHPGTNPDGSIPVQIWDLFRGALLDALAPYKEPRERVVKAIAEMEAKLQMKI